MLDDERYAKTNKGKAQVCNNTTLLYEVRIG
jgi:hypothetical protein